MHEIIFVIPNDPVPWARPAHNKRRIYDGQLQQKHATRHHIESQIPENFELYQGPLALHVTFFLALPQKKKGAHHEPEAPHFYKPDLSNLIKHIEDCCTGLLYPDDSLIAALTANKKYDTIARTEFVIRELRIK